MHSNYISASKNLIKSMYLKDKKPWVIGYSGGKDSTTLVQIVLESIYDLKAEGQPVSKQVFVISSDTLVETPLIIKQISNTLDGVNKFGLDNDLPITAHIVRPKVDQTFWANIIGRGYPSPNQTFRWCTDRMKIDPANEFIKDVVSEHGEVIMLLGVRDGESLSRDRVLDSHTHEGKDLMRHTTLKNAYVFAPIRHFSVDDIWEYLLSNPSPWGSDHRELYALYADSSAGECPLMVDEEIKQTAGSCGNSRFGCWVCTVVNEDKALTGFIETGEEWLRPLLQFRNWLAGIRDNREMRMKRRTSGHIYYSRIDFDGDKFIVASKGKRKRNVIEQSNGKWFDLDQNEWQVFETEAEAARYITEMQFDLDSDFDPMVIAKTSSGHYGQLGLGPFTFNSRKEILRRLLDTQKNMTEEIDLISVEELKVIRKLWFEQGDWSDSVPKIFADVYGYELEWDEDDNPPLTEDQLELLSEICQSTGVDIELVKKLVQKERQNAGFKIRKNIMSDITKILNTDVLHLEHLHEDF
jgi:DNA sulfur modification protein DndC